jgi:hypothetical protein
MQVTCELHSKMEENFIFAGIKNLKEDKVDSPGRLYLFDKCHLSWVLLDNYQKQYLNNQKDVLLIYQTFVLIVFI